MYNSNLAIKNNEYEIPEWDYFVTEIKNVFNLSQKEFQKLRNSSTAKLIAAIPFAAGCYEPERTAIAHLCLYEVELKGFLKHCSHTQSDDKDIFNRLAFIGTFEGGNEKIIEYGMNMLAYIMIEGYHKSERSDRHNNVYNPFVSGAWDYNKTKSKILNVLNSYSNPILDGIFTVGGGWQ